MQPRTLDQINSSLGSIYDPQTQSIQKQLADIPNQTAAEEQGLQAKQTQAFGDILNGARSRGVGVAFGGIPLADQAQYTASTYMPALAQLHTAQKQQQNSLSDAINKLNADRFSQSQGIYQYENDFAEKQREFNDQQALARQQAAAQASSANSFNPSLGGYMATGAAAGAGGGSRVSQRADGGFNFTDANGNPISAAAYAHATGSNFRDVLQRMASAGDQGAKQALGFVGNDYGYDPSKITSANMANLYNSLVWGTGKQASYNSTIPLGTANGSGVHINVPGSNTPANGPGSGHPNIRV